MKFKFLAVFIFFLLVLRVFSVIPRFDFWLSLGVYTLLFALFVLLCYLALKVEITLRQMLVMALLSRLVFFFANPLHSDDYFRFFWDGQLVLHQIDPFEYTPSQILETEMLPPILEPIYRKLNSPHYFSVYPITNQVLFTGAAWLGGSSIQRFLVWLRVGLVLFELIGVWVLCHLLEVLKKDRRKVLLYAINPLVLLEITGNLHFEGLLLTFLFLGLWALAKGNIFKSGLWIGMAISVKLTPLIILPLVLKYLSIQNFCIFISIVLLVCAVFFAPLAWLGNLGNFITSLQLYYGKFEFNASIYYLIRELGFMVKGYNIIESASIIFSLLVFALICYLAWSMKMIGIQVFIQSAIVAYFIYLLLGMVVHPWYIIPLLGLGILGDKASPLVWSYLIYLSYYAYSVDPYRESFILLFIQYAGLFVIAFVEYFPYLYRQKTYIIPPK